MKGNRMKYKEMTFNKIKIEIDMKENGNENSFKEIKGNEMRYKELKLNKIWNKLKLIEIKGHKRKCMEVQLKNNYNNME